MFAKNFHKTNLVEVIGEIFIKSRVLLVFSEVKLCNHLKKLNQVNVINWVIQTDLNRFFQILEVSKKL